MELNEGELNELSEGSPEKKKISKNSLDTTKVQATQQYNYKGQGAPYF